MSKEKARIESDGREKVGRRRLRGVRVIAREQFGKRTAENMTCRKVTWGESGCREGGLENEEGYERSTCVRRKDEGKKGNESRCDKREMDNRDADRKKGGRKERDREGVVVCLPGARIEHVSERVDNILGDG